jgi:hypothetical protein
MERASNVIPFPRRLPREKRTPPSPGAPCEVHLQVREPSAWSGRDAASLAVLEGVAVQILR